MAQNYACDREPFAPGVPTFVAHERPDSENDKYRTLARLCLLTGGHERLSESYWYTNGWLPKGDETDELRDKGRRQGARSKRMQRIRDGCKRLSAELLRENTPDISCASDRVPLAPDLQGEHDGRYNAEDINSLQGDSPDLFGSLTHSFCIQLGNTSPSSEHGWDLISEVSVMGSAIERLDAREAKNMLLDMPMLQERLEDQTTQLTSMIETAGKSVSGSDLSNLSNLSSDQMLIEMSEAIEDGANRLATLDFVNTDRDLQAIGRGHTFALPGSIIFGTRVDSAAVALIWDALSRGHEDKTLLHEQLEEMGVVAVGRIFEPAQVVRLFGYTEERTQIALTKLDSAMRTLGNQPAPVANLTDLAVYVMTDLEPTNEEAVQMFNNKFQLAVMSAVRKANLDLDQAAARILRSHETCEELLVKSDASLSSAYEYIASCSVASSLAASDSLLGTSQVLAMASNPHTPPRNSAIITATIALPSSRGTSAETSAVDVSDLVEVSDSRSADARSLANELDSAVSPDLPRGGPMSLAKQRLGAPENGDGARAAPVAVTAAVHDRPVISSPSFEPPAPPKRPSYVEPSPSVPSEAGCAFMELTRPAKPTAALLALLGSEPTPAQRSRVPRHMKVLNTSLAEIGEEVDGEQPFEDLGQTIGEEESKTVGEVLKECHKVSHPHEPCFPLEHWEALAAADHVRLHRRDEPDLAVHSLDQEMRRDDKLEFEGATKSQGCILGAISRSSTVGRQASEIAKPLVDWLGPRAEFVFCGTKLRDLVRWDLLPPNLQPGGGWTELLARIVEDSSYLPFTGADWVLLVATAHVYGPICVFDVGTQHAVRFVAADGEGSQRGFVLDAQLPAASESWIRLGRLPGGHFVGRRSKLLAAEVLLGILKEIDADMIKMLPKEIKDGYILLAPSKTGKSTIINILMGNTLFEATPRPPKGRKKSYDPALAVLGEHVKGSKIGAGRVSETLYVNVCELEMEDGRVRVVIDTPGMMGTQAEMIEVVNAVSIAKVIARVKALRFIVIAKEDAFTGTGEALAATAATMSNLLANAGGVASAVKNVVLWVNPHKPEAGNDVDGIIEELEAIKGARPEIREFVGALASESKRVKKNSSKIYLLEYEKIEAFGAQRDQIVEARQKMFPNEDPDEPVYTASFPVDELKSSMVYGGEGHKMENPGLRCGLPLTLKAEAEITNQASDLYDAILMRLELQDFVGIRRYLDLTQALVGHMAVGASQPSTRRNTTFERTYQKALGEVSDRLVGACGEAPMARLCQPITLPSPISATHLDSISRTMRVAAAAAVLEVHVAPHMGPAQFRSVGIEAVADIVLTHVNQLCDESLGVLSQSCAVGLSNAQTAHALFEQKLSVVLRNFQSVSDHFSLLANESSSSAAASAAAVGPGAFAATAVAVVASQIAQAADVCYAKLSQAAVEIIELQATTASDLVVYGLKQSTSALLSAGVHSNLGADAEQALETSQAIWHAASFESSAAVLAALESASGRPYEASSNVLGVLQIAEKALSSLVNGSAGSYEAALKSIEKLLREQSQLASKIAEEQDSGSLGPLLARLLFLLQTRSSSLRQHVDAGCMRQAYEDPVERIVSWHRALVDVVLKAAKSPHTPFAERVGEFRPQVELCTKLSVLASVESMPSCSNASAGDQVGMIASDKWGKMRESANELVHHIRTAVASYTLKASSKLEDHRRMAQSKNTAALEMYEYTEHNRDLAVLESALWCDEILGGDRVIERCIQAMWQDFVQHMEFLTQGEDGAVFKLLKGDHKAAKTLLIQIRGMEKLWKRGEGEEGLKRDLLADDACSSAAARRCADMYNSVRLSVNSALSDRCEKVRCKVFEREGPAWMDASVKDANTREVLSHLNSLLDLCNELLGTQGPNSLDKWLDLAELEQKQIECRNVAMEIKDTLRGRIGSLYSALGECDLGHMDDAIRRLLGGSSPAIESNDGEDTASEGEQTGHGAVVQTTSANQVKAACLELVAILRMLSQPALHPALFVAMRDDSDPEATAPDDLASFHELEKKYTSAYMECTSNFSHPATEPSARLKAISIFRGLAEETPTDKLFERFNATHSGQAYTNLVNANRAVTSTIMKSLKAAFYSHEFSEQTIQDMRRLQHSAESNVRARNEYQTACSWLYDNVKGIVERIRLGFSLMQYPDSTFSTQDHIVKPWKNLQAACTHSCFLKDVDLEQMLAALQQSFEQAFKEHVIKPLGAKFDLGYYSDAEGLDGQAGGFKWVSVLVKQLAVGEGALGKIAKEALEEERERQRAALKKLPAWTDYLPAPEKPADQPLEGSDSVLAESDKEHAVLCYFDTCHKLCSEMDKCGRSGDLAREYAFASEAITAEVRRTLLSEFETLLAWDFLSLTRDRVDYLDRLQRKLSSSSYSDRIKHLEDFDRQDGVKERIKNWHGAQPEAINPVSFVELAPEKQAELIAKTQPGSVAWRDYVREFTAEHITAVSRAEELLALNPVQVPEGEITKVISELRARAGMAQTLPQVQLDLGDTSRIEKQFLDTRQDLERQMTSSSGIFHGMPVFHEPSREQWDLSLKRHMQTYIQYVKVAVRPPDSSALTGKEIITLLTQHLQMTAHACVVPLESVHQVQLAHAALLSIQRWEPTVAAGGLVASATEKDLFEIAQDLEEALVKEGTLDSASRKIDKMVVEKPHSKRANAVSTKILVAIEAAKQSLERLHSYDPKNGDVPLDPKPFEVLVSPEMERLIQLVEPRLSDQVEALKNQVASKARSLHVQLTKSLDARRNKDANAVFTSWKFLEPIAQLPAFANISGADAFDAELKEHAEKLAQQARTSILVMRAGDKPSDTVAKPIIMLAKFGSDIARASTYASNGVHDVLAQAESKLGLSGMQSLATELRKLEPATANEIISSSDSFQTLVIEEFNEKTKRPIHVVKQKFAEKNKGIEHAAVWDKYAQFETDYKRYLNMCIDPIEQIDDPLAYLVEQARDRVGLDKLHTYGLGGRLQRFVGLTSGESQQQIPHVLAAIFAWWTIEFYLRLKRRGGAAVVGNAAKLRHANNGQVVCILRLLGATSSGSMVDLQNHLAEVPTGEGKSVIIGVLATTLGLYGYRVDCACYSSMLSSRDYDDFVPMFKSFGLLDKIRYGTFDTLSEHLMMEQHGDLRSAARDLLSNQKQTHATPGAGSPRVLICDEVDVFCSEAFFGGSYSPLLKLQNDQIAALMRYIWSVRRGSFDLRTIRAHQSYKDVLSSGVLAPQYEWLLQRAAHEMHKAAHDHGSKSQQQYIVREGKIAYRLEGRDEYSAQWSYQYETNAAYLYEAETGKISEAQLVQELAIHVRCGEFSYAKLPKAFKYILGVTGTLDESKLPPQMHDVLRRDLNIKHFTYCPSMYHAQTRDWEPKEKAYVQLANDSEEHFHLLVEEIKTRLKPLKAVSDQRSVIVFFRDVKELNSFRDSSYFSTFRDAAQVLTEITAATRDERENIIKATARQGMVTLATRTYGRGTDFKIFDDRMEDCGGLHVLQTFFSRDLSEFIQIQGRCARQGNRGSYSMVLELSALARDFDRKADEIKAWPPTELHENMSKIRLDLALKEVQALRDVATKRKQTHDSIVQALKAYQSGRADEMGKLIRRYNSDGGLIIGPKGLHVIVCLDDSYSMRGAQWDEAVTAFKDFKKELLSDGSVAKHLSVLIFNDKVRTVHTMVPLDKRSSFEIKFGGGYTEFLPPINAAADLISKHGPAQGYTAVLVFMSDGGSDDVAQAAQVLEGLAAQHVNSFASYTVGFGAYSSSTLQAMAFAGGAQESRNYSTAGMGNLADAFSKVASSITPGRSG